MDILVFLFPNLKNIEKIIVIDPYDSKTKLIEVVNMENIKEILIENLPFCSQNHEEALIHGGFAYLIEWDNLKIVGKISREKDIDDLLG